MVTIPSIAPLAGVRPLLGLLLTLGLLSSQAERGTLAFFTDSITSSGNTFSTGSLK